MKKMSFVLFVISLLIINHFAYAQFGKTAHPRFYSDFKPVVGGWSQYQIITKGQPSTKIKVAIVGKEGEDYWYETVSEKNGGEKVITKVLVAGNPEDRRNVKRMIVKAGDQPPLEMPLQMMQPSKLQERKDSERGVKFIDKGPEIIKVPAGSFKARHIQYQAPEGVMDSWIFEGISPYGLVKSQSKDMEMVLIAYGTGAKTEITENPKKFEMPTSPQIPGKKQGR